MKKILRTTLLLMSVLAMGIVAVAADKRPITAQDLWALKRLGSPALSPDGSAVVFTVQEWSVEKNKSTSNLWPAEVATGAVRRLTRANASDGSPVLESGRCPDCICFKAWRGRNWRALCHRPTRG